MLKQNNLGGEPRAMNKSLTIFFMLLSIGCANAQERADDFNVGPYEVYYKGPGDVNFRLRKGIDLYEYFGLQKDTVIQVEDMAPKQLNHAVQVSLFGRAGLFRYSSFDSMSCGLEVDWKQRIANKTYINGGLSIGYGTAARLNVFEEFWEVGIPVSLELTNLNKTKSSLYGSIGIAPTYCSVINTRNIMLTAGDVPENNKGIYFAPRLDCGGYIPIGRIIVKAGLSFRYRINSSAIKQKVYYQIIERSIFGVNLGLVF